MGEQSYTVYEPERVPDQTMAHADELVFVKDGFSWFAMIAPVIWMLWHRMWWPLAGFLLVFGVLILLGSLFGISSEGGKTVLMMGLNLGFGFIANDLRRFMLERQGYRLVGAVAGFSEQECERRFYSDWQPLQHSIALKREQGSFTS